MDQIIHSRKICIDVKKDLVPIFFPLLQTGFMVKTPVNCTVQALLCDQIGISLNYLTDRIQTIFLDGKPIDHVNSAMVRHGSTLALSAAMPGLVGATLRKGGVFSQMRSQISHRQEDTVKGSHEGLIFLKLFNLLLRELGPGFLQRGIWVDAKEFLDIIERWADDFRTHCRAVWIDGEKTGLNKLRDISWKDEYLFLQVKIQDEH